MKDQSSNVLPINLFSALNLPYLIFILLVNLINIIFFFRMSVLMSKFDAMRASGDMMPTAMGTAAMDGKNSSFTNFLIRIFIGARSHNGVTFYLRNMPSFSYVSLFYFW